MSRIFPVVEVVRGGGPFWLPLPPEPWPGFVELSRNGRPEDVAMVLLTLSTYGSSEKGGPASPNRLVRRFPGIAPGGLAASDGITTIYPSCCCGLEDWRSWYKLLTTGQSPWLGHDPDPWCEAQGDEFVVWPDCGFKESSRRRRDAVGAVVLSRAELIAGRSDVERSLEGFTERILSVLQENGVPEAESIARQFRSTFVGPQASEPE